VYISPAAAAAGWFGHTFSATQSNSSPLLAKSSLEIASVQPTRKRNIQTHTDANINKLIHIYILPAAEAARWCCHTFSATQLGSPPLLAKSRLEIASVQPAAPAPPPQLTILKRSIHRIHPPFGERPPRGLGRKGAMGARQSVPAGKKMLSPGGFPRHPPTPSPGNKNTRVNPPLGGCVCGLLMRDNDNTNWCHFIFPTRSSTI